MLQYTSGPRTNNFIIDSCTGFTKFRKTIWDFDILKISEITGIPEEQIRATGRMFAKAKSSSVLYGLETTSTNLQKDCSHALVNLSLLTGNVGENSGGIYPLFTGTNEQGAKDMGVSPFYNPGYKPVKKRGSEISEIINQDIDYVQQISEQSILFALRYKKTDYDDLIIKIKSKKYIKTAAMIGQYAAPLDLRR